MIRQINNGLLVNTWNGNVICRKCLERNVLNYMYYDRHFDDKSDPKIGMDRFMCPDTRCYHVEEKNGMYGVKLDYENPYKIWTWKSFFGRLVSIKKRGSF